MTFYRLGLILLVLRFQLVWTTPHVFKRDSDGVNETDHAAEPTPTEIQRSVLTTLPSNPEELRDSSHSPGTQATLAKGRPTFSTTTNSLELQLPSYADVEFANKRIVTQKTTMTGAGLNSAPEESLTNKSSPNETDTVLNVLEIQESVTQVPQGQSTAKMVSPSKAVASLTDISTDYKRDRDIMKQLMQADGRFSTSAMPQKVTVPSIPPRQVKKPQPAKSANVTQKLKNLSGNSVLPKTLTTPKTAVKTIEKKYYSGTGSVLSKKPYVLTTEKPPTTIPMSSNSVDSLFHLSCGGIAPTFKTVRNNGTYHVRNYPASAWLSTSVITNNRILAELEARNKLQRYFDGDNEKGIRLNQTCPVLTQIKFKAPFSESREKVEEFAVSFYLPWNGKMDIASPNDSEVLVDIVEERVIYVHGFEARVWEMTDSFLQSEARKLGAELRKTGEAFLSKYFYVASYAKSPTSDEFSRYEIWLYATRFRPQDVLSVRQPLTNQPLSEITRRTRARVCKGFECPNFEVLAVHNVGIQKRRYYGARFATYLPEFCAFTKAAIWRAFMPLHLYKHGVNSHFEVIGATRPAGIVHVKENSSAQTRNASAISRCNQTFTVSLYLPKRLHAAPPVAGSTAPRIKITELDDVIVYVQSVGGFLLVPERIQKEIELFRQRLLEQNLCYRSNEYYLVVYDYITRFHGRLNEIWVVADRCPDSL